MGQSMHKYNSKAKSKRIKSNIHLANNGAPGHPREFKPRSRFSGWTDNCHNILVNVARHMWLPAGIYVSQDRPNSHNTTAARISCQMSVPATLNTSLQQSADLLQRCKPVEMTQSCSLNSCWEHIQLNLQCVSHKCAQKRDHGAEHGSGKT